MNRKKVANALIKIAKELMGKKDLKPGSRILVNLLEYTQGTQEEHIHEVTVQKVVGDKIYVDVENKKHLVDWKGYVHESQIVK